MFIGMSNDHDAELDAELDAEHGAELEARCAKGLRPTPEAPPKRVLTLPWDQAVSSAFTSGFTPIFSPRTSRASSTKSQ